MTSTKKPTLEKMKQVTFKFKDSGQLAPPTASWMFVSQTRIGSPVAANGPVQSARVAGKEKETKTPRACLENCHHFTPFVLSVGGLLGSEAKSFAK
jgi:hypothetical protein